MINNSESYIERTATSLCVQMYMVSDFCTLIPCFSLVRLLIRHILQTKEALDYLLFLSTFYKEAGGDNLKSLGVNDPQPRGEQSIGVFHRIPP